MDGQFLDQHKLPDGNLYKMEGGTGELNNQGQTPTHDYLFAKAGIKQDLFRAP